MSLIAVLFSALLALPLQDAPGEDVAVKLVQRIQQDLSEVDRLLEQASDAPRLADELKDARSAHVRAISDLEELIRQIKYRRSGQSSSDSSCDNPGSGSSSKPSPREADDRRQTDTAPTPQDAAAQKEKEQQQQQQGGTKPQDSAQPEASPGAQRDASQPPPPDPLDDFLRRDTDARWGVLPPKMQERLMNLHVDDVPQRYRTWLEAYVRELNRRDTGASGP